jgi:hypothetical protein
LLVSRGVASAAIVAVMSTALTIISVPIFKPISKARQRNAAVAKQQQKLPPA